jgi:hypothetical protein
MDRRKQCLEFSIRRLTHESRNDGFVKCLDVSFDTSPLIGFLIGFLEPIYLFFSFKSVHYLMRVFLHLTYVGGNHPRMPWAFTYVAI